MIKFGFVLFFVDCHDFTFAKFRKEGERIVIAMAFAKSPKQSKSTKSHNFTNFTNISQFVPKISPTILKSKDKKWEFLKKAG